MLFRKSHCFPMLLAVVLMLCAGSALAKIESVNASYRKAEKLYKAKNYEKAEKLYQKSLAQCDEEDMDCRIKTLVGLRTLYTDTKQYEQAIQIQNQFFEDYQQGKEIFYSLPSLFEERAEIYAKQGNLDLAAQDYREAIRLYGQELGLASFKRVKSMGNLTKVYEQQGKIEAAVELKKQTEEDKVKQRSCNNKETDVTPFIVNLQRRIRLNWFLPKEQLRENYQIIAVFRVWSDGTISHVRLTKPTKSLAANQSALVAVEKAAPFQHISALCYDYLDIEFSFDHEAIFL